jgi:hypothetical protein
MPLCVLRRLLVPLTVVLCSIAWPQHVLAQGCTISWDGGGGSVFWQNRFNWNPDRLPMSTDVACIGVPTVTLSGFGDFNRVNKLISTGALTVSGSILQLDTGGSLGGHLTIVSSGQVDNRGPLSVGGTLTINGSSLNGAGGTTSVTNGITFQGFVDAFGQTLNNSGTATFGAGFSRVRMPGGTFNNLPGATFEAADGVGFDSLGGAATFNNQGTVLKTGPSSVSETVFGGVRFNNTGTLDIRQGRLRFTNVWSQTQGSTLLAAGTTLESSNPVEVSGGVLSGTGSIKGNLVVTNGSTILPGGGLVGELVITGNYSQDATSTLIVDIGGTAAGAFDRLSISGTAALGGTLDGNLVGPYTPAPGDRVRVMTFTAAAGSFAAILVPGFTGEQNPTDLTLVAREAECTYSIDPSEKAFPVEGGIGEVEVMADDGCDWIVVNPGPLEWITIVSGAAGSGDGLVRFSVHTQIGAEREGFLIIAGKLFRVTQAPCTYVITPTEAAVPAEEDSRSVEVTTPGRCRWEAVASPDDDWLSITSAATGEGDGIVGYHFETNEGPERQGTLIPLRT